MALRDVTPEQQENHKEELPGKVYARSRFIVDEHRRVHELANALPVGNSKHLQQLFHDSYRGARDLFEITVPAMEQMMSVMEAAPGTIAARQAGAGFGGCMVALVDKVSTQRFTEHVNRVYAAKSGRKPGIFVVTASAGACPLVID